MDVKSQRQKGRDSTLSALNVAIEVLNIAKEVSSATPAKAVFGSVSVLLTMIRVRPFSLFQEMYRIHTQPGLDGEPTGLRRNRIVLC